MQALTHASVLLWLLGSSSCQASAGSSARVADCGSEPIGAHCIRKTDSLSDLLSLLQTSSRKVLDSKLPANRARASLAAATAARLGNLDTPSGMGQGERTAELAVVLLVPVAIFVLLAIMYCLSTKSPPFLKFPVGESSTDEQSALSTMALGMARRRRTVFCAWAIVALLGFCGACRLPSTLSNSMAPSPGMPSQEANSHFQSVFPAQARASAFVCIMKAEPPAKILDVPHLRNFTFALRAELNSTGRLMDFNSNASFWFESGVDAKDMFVSPDGSVMIMEWTASDDFDTMAASQFAKWSRQVLKKHADQLKGISFHGLVSVADLFNFVMSDLVDIVKTSIGVVVPAVCLVLWGMLGSWRLLLIPVVTFTSATGASCGVMYVWGHVQPIHACTPSVVSCMLVAFAMDFSLFILTRFRDEVRRLEEPGSFELAVPEQVERAMVKAMETSGRTVLTSTVLLLAPLLALTCFPIRVVSSMGVGASASLCSVLVASLSLVPAVLATFPHFFHAGVSRGPAMEALEDRLVDASESEDTLPSAKHDDCYSPRWVWTATLATSWPWNFIIVLVAAALAARAGWATRLLLGANSLEAFIPRHTESYEAFLQLRDAFGLGTAVPFKVMLEPPAGESVLSRDFWEQSQLVVNAMATELPGVVRSTLAFPNYAMGLPVPWLVAEGCALAGERGSGLCKLQGLLLERFSNEGRTAMWGHLRTDFDPMTQQGVKFTHDLRRLAASWAQRTGIRVTVVGNAADSADVVSKILDLFPTVAAVNLAVVLGLCGVIFRSALIPVWQSLTICMTLLYAYGLAVITYQEGGLEWTGASSLSGTLGAMPWMCVVTAFPFVVGLCLDYDIFLLVRVNEFRAQGMAPADAIRHGVCSTGNIITAAGVIMGGTFASLLLSNILFINSGAFIMVTAVLFDTFFIRTLVVPAAMSLAGRFQWWPSELSHDIKPPPQKVQPAPPQPESPASKAERVMKAVPPKPSGEPRRADPGLRSRRWSKQAPKGSSYAAGPLKPGVESEQSTASTTPRLEMETPEDTGSAEPQSKLEAEQSIACVGGVALQNTEVDRLPESAKAMDQNVELFLHPSDAPGLEAVSQAAVVRLMDYAEEVQMGHWGDAIAGTKETGLVYMRRINGCSTTAFAGVLNLEDKENGTLERVMETTTPSALARHLDNCSEPSVYREVCSFGPRATVLSSHSRRRCLLVELARASLDIYCKYGAPLLDRSGAECYVTAFASTNGFVAQEALAAASEFSLTKRLAEQARAEAGPDAVLMENHLTGFVIRRGDHETLRMSCILQLDPVVSFAPRAGLDYAQFQMVQDGLLGVLKEIGQDGV